MHDCKFEDSTNLIKQNYGQDSQYSLDASKVKNLFNNIIEDAKEWQWRRLADGGAYNYSYFSFLSVIATYCNMETKQDYKSLLKNNW